MRKHGLLVIHRAIPSKAITGKPAYTKQQPIEDKIMTTYLTDNEPDSSGPLGECRYNCGNAEHVGNHKYVCLHPDHWIERKDCNHASAIKKYVQLPSVSTEHG